MPDEFKEIYKVGNYIKRTFFFGLYPPKPEIFRITNVSKRNFHDNHTKFIGYSYTRHMQIHCRTMYYTNEDNISDEVIEYTKVLAIIL